jgi:Tfp pilus assembly protein PilF
MVRKGFLHIAMRHALLALLVAGCAGERAVVAPAPAAPAPAAPAVDVPGELAAAERERSGGHPEAAREHLERVVAADPTVLLPRLDLAELLLADGAELDRAERLLEEAQLLRGASASAARIFRLRGSLHELRGEDAAAAEAYRRSLGEAPDADLRLRRALLLGRLGKSADATVELVQVLAERPADRAALSALAELHETTGDLSSAELELSALAQRAPADPAPLRRLAAFHRRHGQEQKARELEARAKKLEAAPRVLRPLRSSR